MPAGNRLLQIAQIGQRDAAKLIDVRILGIGNQRRLEIIQFDFEIARLFRGHRHVRQRGFVPRIGRQNLQALLDGFVPFLLGEGLFLGGTGAEFLEFGEGAPVLLWLYFFCRFSI